MYIYNVTINIDKDIESRWLEWMKKEHIPAMLATGKFSKALLTRIQIQEESGVSFSVQYTTDSKETLERYYAENAEELRKQNKIFEGKFVAFRTELEVVSEH